jgi:hypothetical protein
VSLKQGLLIAAAVALFASAAAAQSLNVVGRWAVSRERCEAGELIEFSADGTFRSTLDEAEPREGSYKTGRDRIILLDENEPDRELALIVLDLTPNRLVAFDETIEADRRLLRCR